MKLSLTAALFSAVLVSATQVMAFEDKDVIDYRQHLMKSLDAQAAALGMVVSTQIPPDNLVAHVESIALTAQQCKKAFEPKVLGGESKPEVWAQWKDFSTRLDAFVANTAKLAQTARTGTQEAVVADMVAALACKTCHDVYREKK